MEKTLMKTAPTTYDIINITIRGIAGESRASSTEGQFSIIKKPMNVVSDAIDIFPRNMKMLPIPATITNFSECFKIKMNALRAETQKFSEARATYM